MAQEIWEYLARNLVDFISNVVALDSRLVTLVFLTIFGVIVIDGLLSRVSQTSKDTGIKLNPKTKALGIEGAGSKSVKDYVSYKQGLAGRPDALLFEEGYVIPVEHKPFAKKIRDRYVAQLLVYMRLIEEFEGKKPPYGYLILGKNSRRVKISNTNDRQQWLSGILAKMQDHIDIGTQVEPDPHISKCKYCSVKNRCESKIESDSSKS